MPRCRCQTSENEFALKKEPGLNPGQGRYCNSQNAISQILACIFCFDSADTGGTTAAYI